MRTRGFSLLEMSVALVIAGLVLAAASTVTVALQRSLTTTRRVVELTTDAGFTLETILRPVRIAGAAAVRPWQAVSTSCVDDGRVALPPCSPADGSARGRLHIVEFATAPARRLVAVTATTATFAPLLNGSCGVPAGTDVVLFPSESRTRALGGPTWRARRCVNAFAPGAGLCGCALSDSPHVGVDVGVAAQDGTPVVDTDFVGGVLVEGRVFSRFIDGSNRLSLFADLDNTGEGVSTPLLPRAFRFSVRHGYDVDVDGEVEQLTMGPRAASLDRLRLLRVGLALSAPAADGVATTPSFLGAAVPLQPGKRVVVVEGNGVLRATGVFQ